MNFSQDLVQYDQKSEFVFSLFFFLLDIYWHTAPPSNYKALPFEGENIKGIFNAILAVGLWSNEREKGTFILLQPRSQ